MSLDDIYYVLFRHKWKILLFSLLGILGAGSFLLLSPVPFQSEARLLIRYVLDEGGAVSPSANGSRVRSPDERGETIIASEIEILTSFDLAKSVADTIGPEKILAKAGGGKDATAAAAFIATHLEVDAGKKGSVIHIIFKHPDPEIVQSVLQEVVDTYIRKHIEVHQTGGALDDFLTRKTDELHNQLSETEKEIRDKRATAGVLSFEDAKKSGIDRASKINLDLLAAESELAERTAVLNGWTKANSTAPSTNATVTNLTAATPLPEIPPAIADTYKHTLDRLDGLWKNYQQLRSQYTEESKLVKEVRAQITEADAQKQKLEQENPRLAASAAPSIKQTGAFSSASAPGIDLPNESVRILGLQSKINFLTSQLEKIRVDMTNLNSIEPALAELERKKQWEETNYNYFEVRLEQSRINDAVGNGKVSNISKVELPTPPSKDSKKTLKTVALIAFGGIGFGIALAFLIELILDPSVKRSKEVESNLKIRLFLTVPDLARNGSRAALKSPKRKLLLPETAGAQPASPSVTPSDALVVAKNAETAPWDDNHSLHIYYEALRDRLVSDFENRNLTHTPKLVAVTGCNPGAGVTTIAVGLAASLSRIGDGNVLLVDMNLEGGAAHQFYKGKPGCGLDAALEEATKETALVQENLYVVTGRHSSIDGRVNGHSNGNGNGHASENGNGNGNGYASVNGDAEFPPRIFPKRFATLFPRLRASDYDYIIFDMPSVSQTSITPRLAKFMDMNLLVIESEKTSTEAAKRASAILAEAKAEYSAILNKTHSYVPAMLNHSLT